MFFLGVWTGFWLALAWDAWITSLYEKPLDTPDQADAYVRRQMPHWNRNGP